MWLLQTFDHWLANYSTNICCLLYTLIYVCLSLLLPNENIFCLILQCKRKMQSVYKFRSSEWNHKQIPANIRECREIIRKYNVRSLVLTFLSSSQTCVITIGKAKCTRWRGRHRKTKVNWLTVLLKLSYMQKTNGYGGTWLAATFSLAHNDCIASPNRTYLSLNLILKNCKWNY